MKNIFCLVGGYTLCSVKPIDRGQNMGYFHIQGDVHLPFNRVKYANDKEPHCGNDPYMPCGHGALKKTISAVQEEQVPAQEENLRVVQAEKLAPLAVIYTAMQNFRLKK